MKANENKKRQPLFHVIRRNDNKKVSPMLIRIFSLAIGLVIAWLVLYITEHVSVGDFFVNLYKGAFGTERKIWITLKEFALLLCVGLALIPAFKMKFWNLGGNGQILIGALACIICMYYMGNAGINNYVINIVSVFASIIAGIIWAIIPAIFKAHFNTNESLFTLMMNYIAAGLVSLFLTIAVKSGSGTLPTLETGQLPEIYNKYLLTIIVAVVMLVYVFIYLKFYKHGYELEVVGESSRTAKYIGINVKKVIIRTMVLSGALCGIVGLLLAGSIDHTISTSTANDMGFTAIMTSWLAHFNPFLMIITTFLVVFLNRGMAQVQTAYGITSDAISKIVIGIVYFCVIAAEFFASYKIIIIHSQKYIEKKNMKKYHALTDGLISKEAM